MKLANSIFSFIFCLALAPQCYAQSTLDELAEYVTKPKIVSSEYDVQSYAGEVYKNIGEDGKWVNGNPGAFALGNPDIKKIYEADYEWLSYLPEEAMEDDEEPNEKVEVAEYDWSGAELSKYELEISKQSYYAQTAACNRSDIPYTHSHTYRALHSSSNYGIGWPSEKALLGSGGLILPPGVGGRIQETGPQIKQIIDFYRAKVKPVCQNPVTKRTYTCVEKAEYLPLQPGLFRGEGGEIGFPSGFCINVDYPGVDYFHMSMSPIGAGDCCPNKIKITHSIDYLFPTAKINLSKQQQVSRYIPSDDVDAGEMGIAGTIYSVKRWLQRTAEYLTEYGKRTARTQIRVVTGENIPELKQDEQKYELTVFEEENEWEFPWGKWNHPWSRSFSRGYLRYLIEIGVMRDYRISPGNPYTYFYPHVWPGYGPEFWGGSQTFGQSQYFTDAFAGPFYATTKGIALSFWLTESAKLSQQNFRRHFQQPEQCVRHNAATGKTPEELLLAICPDASEQCREAWTAKRALSPEAPKDFNDPCLHNVGEIFPVTAFSRPYNSDYIFQTIAKGLRQYMTLYRESINRFSFDRTLDRFHFYPSGELKDTFPRDKYAKFRRKRLEESLSDIYEEEIKKLEGQLEGLEEGNDDFTSIQEKLEKFKKQQAEFEIPYELNDKMNLDTATKYQCSLFDEMNAAPGYAFQNVNKNTPEVIGAHGELSGEIFTNFSGCWGFPADTNWFLDPDNEQSGVLRILPSYWDSRDERLRVR